MSRQKLVKKLMNTKLEVTPKELRKIKEGATLEAIQIVSVLPLLILRDKYGFGEVRLSRYVAHMGEAIDDLNAGRFTLVDVSDILREEVGIDVFTEEEK